MPPLAPLLLLAGLLPASVALTFVSCECSVSPRGFRSAAEQSLLDTRANAQQHAAALRRDGKTDLSISSVTIARTMQQDMLLGWDNCVSNYSTEECVNADAALRLGKCYPSCDSFCKFDEGTWKSVVGGRRRESCDKMEGFASGEAVIVDGEADKRTPARPSPTPSSRPSVTPEPTPTQSSIDAPAAAPVVAAIPPGRPAVSAAAAETGTPESPARPAPAQRGPRPIVVNIPPQRTPNPGFIGEQAPQPTAEDILLAESSTSSANEGCVAVEHLEGYVLQHPTHLRRPVLCAHGFCATPNHAIIVGDKLTSMKVMCKGEWRCVRTVKWVNNLKVAANRRAKVNELVTVTPYDLRFPRAAVWIVQMGEDVLRIVGASVAAAAVALFALVVTIQMSL